MRSVALQGTEGRVIEIKAGPRPQGDPTSRHSYLVEGWAPASARETRVRVGAAIEQALGEAVRLDALVVTATGAAEPLGGGAHDLAAAAAILTYAGRLSSAYDDAVLLGELSLTGAVRPGRGLLPMLRAALAAGVPHAVVPHDQRAEAAVAAGWGLGVASARTLADLVHERLEPVAPPPAYAPAYDDVDGRSVDLADLTGLEAPKRALEVAAAGGHGLLLVAPPGAGATLLSRRLPTILPGLTEAEALEATCLHSVAGLLREGTGLLARRPYRAPHHTVSAAGLVGGGAPSRPGEASLAHEGVLYLDELPEFRASTLESLAHALRAGEVTLARGATRTRYATRAQLVASATPCPCGYHGDGSDRCACPADRVQAWQARLAASPVAPLLDVVARLVPAPRGTSQAQGATPETSAVVRARVEAARARQAARAARLSLPARNAQIATWADAVRAAGLDAHDAAEAASLLTSEGCDDAMRVAVLRIARTVADLVGAAEVRPADLAEAMALTWGHAGSSWITIGE